MFNFMRRPPLRRLMLMNVLGGGGSWDTITGNPVSFSAKAAPLRQLKVAFSPKQDLHGYDSPWPAGGGKNLLPPAVAKSETVNGCTVTSDGNGRFTISGTPSATAVFTFDLSESFVIPDGSTHQVAFMNSVGNANLMFNFYNNTTPVETWVMSPANRVSTYSAMSGKTTNKVVISVPMSFSGTATISPMFLLQTSDASTFAPYSNECPISGWSSLGVEQTGKNLLQLTGRRIVTTGTWGRTTPRDFSEPSAYIGITMDGYFNNAMISDYSISENEVDVTRVQNGGGYGIGLTVVAKPNTQYVIGYTDKVQNYVGIGFYDKDGVHISYHPITDATKWTFTTPENCVYMMVVLRPQVYDVETEYKNLQLEFGTTASAYEPYNPLSRSISISLGSTVYSGTLDVVTGVLTVDWVGEDGGTFEWSKVNNNAYRTFATTPTYNPKKGNDPSSAINILAPNYKSESFNSASGTKDNYIWVTAETTNQVCIKDTSKAEMSVADFTAYMAGMIVVYRLAEPQTFQLTPQEVSSLLGVNNMWSDANGDLTVEYRSN